MNPSSEKISVTVIVPTRNEALNIAGCLESLFWADQIFVVDSHSTDATCEIAIQYGAAVVQFEYDGGWPKKKNWAIQNLPIRNPWFLIVDADERVSCELREEISRAIVREDIDGYYVRWKFIFLGRWMKHCWRHGWMLRLVRTGKGEYEDLGMRGEGGWDNEVHENLLVQGCTAKLVNWLDHNSNQSLSYWIRKQNEFSDWNAIRRLRQLKDPMPPFTALLWGDLLDRRKWLKAFFLRLPMKPLVVFMYLYILSGGIFDGKAGFYFCMLRAFHELTISAKIFEINLIKNR